jgi:hypothetical protein
MRNFYIIVCLMLCLGFAACDGMTDNYMPYFENGEIIYPEKASNVVARPGKHRVELSWLIKSDPFVSAGIIYWNSRNDSIEMTIDKADLGVKQRILIENLAEETYNFEMYTFDNYGNRSVGAEVVAAAYGDRYRLSITNRSMSNMTVNEDGSVDITWDTAPEGMVSQDLVYRDADGTDQLVAVPAADRKTLLPSYDFTQSGLLTYGVFLPDTAAIDTFRTEAAMVKVERVLKEKEVDRLGFRLFELPGDYSVNFNASSTVDLIWKNSGCIDSGTFISAYADGAVPGHPLPQWFTIDMGKAFDLTKIILYQRGSAASAGKKRLYAGGNLREFEVWGATAPDETWNPDEHGGDFGPTWTLLKSCYVVRPSGDVVPTGSTRSDNTDDDVLAAINGHEYLFDTTQPVRYLRIKGISNWDSAKRGFVNISAIRLWAMQY